MAETYYLVEDALGYFPLRGFRDLDDLIVSDNRDSVAVGIEPDAFAGNVVDYDGIEVFRH